MVSWAKKVKSIEGLPK